MPETITKKPTKTNKPGRPRRNTKTKTELIIKTAQEHPDLSTRDIGAIANCSHVNVVTTLKRYNINHEHVKSFKEQRADIFAGLQHRLLSSVTDADIQKTPVGSRILASAQLYDKERLERGQSSENITLIHADIAKIRGYDENKYQADDR